MLVSTRARLISAFLIIIAIVLSAVSLFTCHWVDHYKGVIHTYNGVFEQKGCAFYSGSAPAWNTATLAMMIIAQAAQIILVVFVVVTSFLPRLPNSHLMKADIALIVLAILVLLTALITFGMSSGPYWDKHPILGLVTNTNFGYSFWLVVPAAFFTLVALVPLFHSLHSIHRGRGDGDWHF